MTEETLQASEPVLNGEFSEPEPETQGEGEPVETDGSESVAEGDQDADNLEDRTEEEKLVAQSTVDKIIGEKVAKQRQAERQAAEYQKQLAELQARLPKEQAPQVPPMPDQWDDDYDRKVVERDQAMIRLAEYKATQKFIRQQEDQRRQVAAAKAQAEYMERVHSFAERAQKIGLSPQDLQEAAQKVAAFGIDPQIENYVIGLDNGPAVIAHLARNPIEQQMINSLSPMDAAVYIKTELSAKLSAPVRKTQAPAPVETLNGNGAPQKVDPVIARGSFS